MCHSLIYSQTLWSSRNEAKTQAGGVNPTEGSAGPIEGSAGSTESSVSPTECIFSPAKGICSPTEGSVSPTESGVSPTEGNLTPQKAMSAQQEGELPSCVCAVFEAHFERVAFLCVEQSMI